MRVLPSVGAAAVAVAATVMLAPAAFANNAPGDNGTIKIHDAKTGEALVKNEPHVCSFYLDAFFFDGEQQANWQIVDKPPTGTTKDKPAASGKLTPGADGHGRTDDMTLPNGHYKLTYTFTGEHSEAGKHKVFWVDCPADSGTGGTTTGGTTTGGDTTGGTTSGTTAGTTGSTTDGSTVSGGATTGGTSTSGVDDTASPSPTSSSGSLAETGASVVGPSLLAAGLVAAGIAFTVGFRRRSAQRH